MIWMETGQYSEVIWESHESTHKAVIALLFLAVNARWDVHVQPNHIGITYSAVHGISVLAVKTYWQLLFQPA